MKKIVIASACRTAIGKFVTPNVEKAVSEKFAQRRQQEQADT